MVRPIINKLINFEKFISINEIFLSIQDCHSQSFFFDLEEIKFENFNISVNDISSVELAKVLVYAEGNQPR
jgi:hypothetical protein